MTTIEVDALIAGDEDAWSVFYADITPKIEQAIAEVLGNSHSEIEIEDLRQDVFVALLENDRAALRNYSPVLSAIDTYVCTMATNRALNVIRDTW